MALISIPGYAVVPPIPTVELTISNVSGTVSHGETLNISGTLFGVKSPVSPTRYEDFEPTGSLRVGGTAWNDFDVVDSDDMAIQSAIANRGSSARIDQGAVNDPTFVPVLGMTKTTPSTDQKFYSFQKNHYDWSGTWVPGGVNHKILRVWSDNGSGSQPDFVTNYSINQALVEGVTGCSNTINGLYPQMSTLQDVWFSSEYYLGQNSATDTCDGILKAYFNNSELVNRANYSFNDTDTTGLLKYYDIEWSQDGSMPSGTAYTYVDDVYIDLNDFAHVILGNASTLSVSTVREIQIPHTTWNETSIQITFNQGSFSTSDTVYLFVVDTDGDVSNGYPLIIV